jgi:hypothetical protein
MSCFLGRELLQVGQRIQMRCRPKAVIAQSPCAGLFARTAGVLSHALFLAEMAPVTGTNLIYTLFLPFIFGED